MAGAYREGARVTGTVRQALERDAEVDAVGFVRRVALALARVAAGWRAPTRNEGGNYSGSHNPGSDPTTADGDAVTAAIRRGAEAARHRGGRDDAETT